MQPVHLSAVHKLVGVPFAEEVKNLFPGAIPLDNYLFVPHRPTETFLLRKMGFDVPAPILTQYTWPGNLTPFAVQKTTCAHLTMNPRAYVLSGLGTGKTKAALWAWDYLNTIGLAGKLIISATLSTLDVVWAAEVFSVLSHRKCVVLHGSKLQRLKRLADPSADIFVINHDGFSTIKQEITDRKDIDALIIDELAVFRNASSQRTKLMEKYAAGMKWVWGMTGSPIPTSPTDAWAQARIVTPNTVPRFFGRFRDELMIKCGPFKFKPKKEAVERAYDALQPSVRFTLSDVAELPDMVERFVDVPMGPQQAKVYKALAEQCYAAVQGKEITAANAGAVLMKLLQVSTGWVYTADRGVVPLDNLLRVQALIDGINGTDRKVLVFSPFKHTLAGISEALAKEGIEHATMSGDTPQGKRTEMFNLFQKTDKFKVLNAHPQCLAHGVTLTAADTIVWFAPVTSLEIYEQANGRIRRVGQKHKQLMLHLQSTVVERKIYKMLQEKQSIQNQLLTLFEEASQ